MVPPRVGLGVERVGLLRAGSAAGSACSRPSRSSSLSLSEPQPDMAQL